MSFTGLKTIEFQNVLIENISYNGGKIYPYILLGALNSIKIINLTIKSMNISYVSALEFSDNSAKNISISNIYLDGLNIYQASFITMKRPDSFVLSNMIVKSYIDTSLDSSEFSLININQIDKTVNKSVSILNVTMENSETQLIMITNELFTSSISTTVELSGITVKN